jgi:hypothetical protein
MLGSPNYYIGIYNGTGANATIRDASEKIQKVFIAAMNQINQTYQLIPFDGRSDYGPFIGISLNLIINLSFSK